MDTITINWGTSRGKDSYGYTLCTLRYDGRVMARTCGGGYDLFGTVLGDFIARKYADRLLALTDTTNLYGLSYHDPDYDPGKAIVGADCSNRTFGGQDGHTVEQVEADGNSFGLERYQAFYRASSKVPTATHRVPLIDGACGRSSVERIAASIGVSFELVGKWRKNARTEHYLIHDEKAEKAA